MNPIEEQMKWENLKRLLHVQKEQTQDLTQQIRQSPLIRRTFFIDHRIPIASSHLQSTRWFMRERRAIQQTSDRIASWLNTPAPSHDHTADPLVSVVAFTPARCREANLCWGLSLSGSARACDFAVTKPPKFLRVFLRLKDRFDLWTERKIT